MLKKESSQDGMLHASKSSTLAEFQKIQIMTVFSCLNKHFVLTAYQVLLLCFLPFLVLYVTCCEMDEHRSSVLWTFRSVSTQVVAKADAYLR